MARFFCLILLIALNAACAGPAVPLATAQSDQEGRQFAPPPPGMAAIYIVGKQVGLTQISLGQRNVGAMTYENWLRVDVPPGFYDIRATGPYDVASLPLTLAPGSTTYLRAYVIATRPIRTGLEIVSPEVGKAAVLAGRRAAEVQ